MITSPDMFGADRPIMRRDMRWWPTCWGCGCWGEHRGGWGLVRAHFLQLRGPVARGGQAPRRTGAGGVEAYVLCYLAGGGGGGEICGPPRPSRGDRGSESAAESAWQVVLSRGGAGGLSTLASGAGERHLVRAVLEFGGGAGEEAVADAEHDAAGGEPGDSDAGPRATKQAADAAAGETAGLK